MVRTVGPDPDCKTPRRIQPDRNESQCRLVCRESDWRKTDARSQFAHNDGTFDAARDTFGRDGEINASASIF